MSAALAPTVLLDGDKLRDARLRADMSQAELARRMKVAQPTVSSWENMGRSPNGSGSRAMAAYYKQFLARLARTLGVEVEAITRSEP